MRALTSLTSLTADWVPMQIVFAVGKKDLCYIMTVRYIISARLYGLT